MGAKSNVYKDEDDNDDNASAFGSHDDINFKYLYDKWVGEDSNLIKDQCISRLAREKFARRVPAKKACEKHMTGSWRVVLGCCFRKCLVGKAFSWDIRETFCLEDF